jgi:hypothetical protein
MRTTLIVALLLRRVLAVGKFGVTANCVAAVTWFRKADT